MSLLGASVFFKHMSSLIVLYSAIWVTKEAMSPVEAVISLVAYLDLVCLHPIEGATKTS